MAVVLEGVWVLEETEVVAVVLAQVTLDLVPLLLEVSNFSMVWYSSGADGNCWRNRQQ
jgi:hypothetical protein